MMATNCENASSSMPGPTADPQLNQSTALESRSVSNGKAIVVGIYGIPGCGKTFLMNQLKQELGQVPFKFYEGSEMIANLVPGGLDIFQKLDEQEKVHWRQLAIDTIGKECADNGRVAVVAGHFMFWPEEEEAGQPVYTQNDLDIFTHILYLDVPAELVAQRLLDDTERSRPSPPIDHLRKWQHAEQTQLRRLCRHHGILFSLVFSYPTLLNKVSTLLLDFQHHTEEYNLSCAESRMNEVLVTSQGQLETVLVMDADRTLAAKDSGALFWKMVSTSWQSRDEECRLKTLFSSPLGYSYTAFRQAALLYEEAADDQEFNAYCEDVASAVTMYPEFVSLLQLVAEQEHVGAVVITCGLRCVWDKVLEREGLSKKVKVIGGGRIADGFVVTAAVKAAIVARLRDIHHMYVLAFGDSVLDLPMLSKADQAIVVVGEEQTRSKTMDAALLNAIDNDGLQARQALLPSNASPRLDTTKLPLIQLTDPRFIDSIIRRRSRQPLQVLHATDRNAAKLLMTPMRDATVAGPVLREAHRRVGWYLATEFLAEMIGVEECPIPHVQGHQISGYRLCHEKTTSIVALMRGGEAMAFGVNEAFPCAMFVHAKRPEDIEPSHLLQQRTIVLVDSVVNSGKTVVNFVQHIRSLHATIRIVVVAGVVQAQSVSEGSPTQALARHANFSLVALRLSDNKFTGRGTTDTGNRLFNTTHLP
ncbi:uracil phosphoribosyltransferase-domain-containing protein [Halenospora varia]|nr:uracil phosphoribosyltransferase-domain-containing protein [Halenospora varia]